MSAANNKFGNFRLPILQGVEKGKQAEEGIKICIESIQRLKECKCVAGFHIMSIE